MNNEISGKTLLSVTASIAAAIISDTPIVSIAGSTLSEITTTTTSTTTTPTATNFDPSDRSQEHQHQHYNNKTLNNPMSDAAAVKSAGGIGTTATAAASTTTSGSTDVSSNVGAGHTKTTTETTTSTNAATAIGKTDDASVAQTTEATKKSDSLEDSCINELNEPDLQKLLEEAYTYKTPKDKKNKSEIFLSLLQKVENEDRGITANASDSHRQHPHSQNRHQQKQGGSLQDLVLLPTDYRRQTSRNKKISSVSSRQREGGSLPSNVNVANCLLGNALDQQQSVRRQTFLLGVDVATATQNLSLTGGNINCKDNSTTGAAIIAAAAGHSVAGGGTAGAAVATTQAGNSVNSNGGSDYIINIGDCMMDIQQQQQIFQSKTLDIASQGLAFYERVDIERRIPRPSVHRTESADFAPTRSHHYVDEAVRFHQIDSGASAGDDYVSDAISAVGSALKSAASCSLPMPLDEHYKSIKSVMGEKGDTSQALKWAPVANGSSSSSNSNSGNNSSTGFTLAKALTRQTDENGNDCERQHSSSVLVSAGQSQAKAKTKKKLQKNNTKTVDLLNVAGYRGYDPVEELVKYIESTEDLNNKHSGGSGKFAESKKKERKKDKEKNSKMKKSNSLEELRSCAKIDVDDLKHSAATTESNNVTMRSKATSGKGGKNNSASAADINKNFENNSGKEIATTSTSGGKQSAAAGTLSMATSTTTATVTAVAATTANNRKGERRSWGTEELQYLGESSNNNILNIDEKAKEKKNKGKEKEKEKEKDGDKEKEKDNKEKEKERDRDEKREKIVNNIDCTVDSEKYEKIETTEKMEISDKSEKLEKRKKSETILPSNITNTTGPDSSLPVRPIRETIITRLDLFAVDAHALLPETAEFHVVTKKKKPKKQRSSTDEVTSYHTNNNGGFNRAHNFIFNAQKTCSTPAFMSQQQPNRYKTYNNHAHMFGAQTNNDGRIEYHNNAGNSGTHQYQPHYGHQQQNQTPHQYHHQQQQQQQQTTENNNESSGAGGSTIGDKSRRKSTSSVPPSEKSDSSDLDSVHSLPIESTTKSKQRHKNAQASAATADTPKNVGGGSPAPISYADIAAAADRSWPSLEASNSHNTSSASTNSNTNSLNTSLEPQAVNINTDNDIRTSTTIQGAAAAIVNNVMSVAAATNPVKPIKNKKLASKPDFPELVATAAMATVVAASADTSAKSLNSTSKPITYSQSLTTTPTALSTTAGSTSSNDAAVMGATIMTSPPPGSDVKQEKRNIATETNKSDTAYNNSNGTAAIRSQQLQQQPQQQLQKSKSVEHDSYSYNSSNLDQQYPALEKTVKRHSATNVSLGSTSISMSGMPVTVATGNIASNNNTSPSTLTTATQFNFAAAAKQQVNTSVAPKAATATLSQVGQPSAALISTTSNANNGAGVAPLPVPMANAAAIAASSGPGAAAAAATTATPTAAAILARKSKEKSPTSVATPPVMNQNYASNANNAQPLAINTAVDSSSILRKAKKEKQQQTLPFEFGTTAAALTGAEQPATNFAQKSTTATQTNAISIGGSDNGHSSGSDNDSRCSGHISSKAYRAPLPPPVVNSNHNPMNMCRSHKSGTSASTNATATVSTSTGITVAPANRPAVIILNDDRSYGSAADMEFTFGDFNEDELKFFDESIIDDDGGCGDELIDVGYVDEQQPQSKSTTTSVAYFNDSGVASDISNANANNAYTETNSTLTFCGDNASAHDSGFHGPSSGKLSKSAKSKNHNDNCGATSSSVTTTLTQHNKLNSFLSTPPIIANSSSNDNDNDMHNDSEQSSESCQNNAENSGCPLPQQLETCNDIETAIIAAARAAAAAEQQQLPPTYRRKQHQLSYGHNYEPPKQSQPQPQHHHHQHHNRQSSYARDAANQHQHQHQHHNHHQQQYYSHSNSSNSASRSRSSSGNDNFNSNCNSYELSTTPPPPPLPPLTSSLNNANNIATNATNIQRKELDIHFIPPSMSAAISALQHNEIIVDFIGSAWEEVAKVTKFYDGQ